jgi:hypothetical protein
LYFAKLNCVLQILFLTDFNADKFSLLFVFMPHTLSVTDFDFMACLYSISSVSHSLLRSSKLTEIVISSIMQLDIYHRALLKEGTIHIESH